MPNNLKKVAVFDIDGTIFRSSLLIELVEALIADGIFPARCRTHYSGSYRRWLDRKGTYEKYLEGVIEAFVRHIKGVEERDFVRTVRKVIALQKNRVYRYTRDLVKKLKKKKYYLLAISHSPTYAVQGFAKKLGFSKVYGRLLELDNRRRFTGRTIHADLIYDKAKILRRAVEKEHLTLKNSVGVGDTESDLPFLKLVEQPICFNPNQTLYQVAKRNHWTVVVERKDVIYTVGRKTRIA